MNPNSTASFWPHNPVRSAWSKVAGRIQPAIVKPARSFKQPGRARHEIIDPVQVRRPIVGFEIRERRRPRSGIAQFGVAFVPALAGIGQRTEIRGHQAAGSFNRQ
jgi:hypothetical protein